MTTLELGKFEIMDVRRVDIDGRPQLVVDCKQIDGANEITVVLSRAMAHELTAAFGPHPLVEEFFADGEELQ